MARIFAANKPSSNGSPRFADLEVPLFLGAGCTDDEDDHSVFWGGDGGDSGTQEMLRTEPSEAWAPSIISYLAERGLRVDDVVDTLGAEPRWLVEANGHAPAAQHPMYGAFGASPLKWTLAFVDGEYRKFAARGSGQLISIAAPRGKSALDIRDAKKIAIAEGPMKAAVIAVATDMFAVSGHGVAFGQTAWVSLCGLLAGLGAKAPFRGRDVFVVGDEGDLADGHTIVAHAVARHCRLVIEGGGRAYVVRHPR